jgi:hypothetical protein
MPIDFNRAFDATFQPLDEEKDPFDLTQDTPELQPILAPEEDPPEEDKPGGFDLLKDLAAAPFRGVQDAVLGTVSLLDDITGDHLDEESLKIFGTASTSTGRFATGIASFMTAFLPAGQLLGAFGRIGKYADITRRSELALKAAGRTKAAIGVSIARGAGAGAIADFAIYDGNEERFSNLIQAIPALSNPLTDFLASDVDDNEVVGRIKNVVEGLGMGAVTDGLFLAAKAMRAQRKVMASGGTVKDAVAAANKAAPEAEVRAAAQAAQGAADGLGLNAVTEVPPPKVKPLAEGQVPRAEHMAEVDSPEAAIELLKRRNVPLKRGEKLRRTLGRKKVLESKPLAPGELDAVVKAFFERQGMDIEGAVSANPRDLTKEQQEFYGVIAGGVNHLWNDGTDGAQFLAQAIEKVFGVHSKTVGSTRLSVKEGAKELERVIGHLTDITGTGAQKELALESLIAEGIMTADTLRVATNKGLALRDVLLSETEVVAEKMRIFHLRGEGSVEQIENQIRLVRDLKTQVDNIATIKGRGLEAQKTPLQGSRLGQRLGDAIGSLDPNSADYKLFTEQIMTGWKQGGMEGAAAVAQMVTKSKSQRGMAVTLEVYINSILGAARSTVTNGISPIIMNAARSFEGIAGGVLTGNQSSIDRGFGELMNLFDGTREAFSLGKRAFQDGGIDPSILTRDDAFAGGGAISGNTFGLGGTPTGAIVDWIGRMIRIPSRVLEATDVANRHLAARTVIKQRLREDGMERISRGAMTMADLTGHIEEKMGQIINDGAILDERTLLEEGFNIARENGLDKLSAMQSANKYVSENKGGFIFQVAEAGRLRGHEAGFTGKLEQGTFGAGFQALMNNTPILRMIAPFVRTPSNILGAVKDRSNVLGVASAVINRKSIGNGTKAIDEIGNKMARKLLDPDPFVRADAAGQLAVGLGFYGAATTLAMSGNITGRGPTDPEERAALIQGGWQPYSLKFGDQTFSYVRLDPFGSFFGIVADMFEYTNASDNSDQGQFENLALGAITSVSNLFTQKSYFQGVQTFLDALSDPERNMERFVGQYTSALVPGIFAQSVTVADPWARETYSQMDRLRNRVPGLSENLAPMRNVLGERMRRTYSIGDNALTNLALPIAYRRVSSDTLDKEFAALQFGFSPPSRQLQGLNLIEYETRSGQQVYDRYLQLHGEVKLEGRSLRQTLTQLVKSGDYKRLDDLTTAEFVSPRVSAIQSVIRDFREEALRTLFRETPQLATDYRNRIDIRRGLKAGAAQGEVRGSSPSGVRIFQ